MDKQPTAARSKTAGILILVFVILFMVLIGCLVGIPMVRLVKDPEKFRQWVSSHGLWGDAAFVGMMFFQVIIALIPGEPFEIGAGYAFGFWEGTFLCLLAVALGSAVIYWVMRKYGIRVALLFFSQEKLDSLSFLREGKRVNTIMFLLLLLPGTPKDLLSYVAGLTQIPFWHWMWIACVSRIPSVVTSTIGGNALGMQNYVFSIVVLAVTLLLSGLGVLVYRWLCKRHSKKSPHEPPDDTTNQ